MLNRTIPTGKTLRRTACAILAVVLLGGPTWADDAPPPNVIFISLDDQNDWTGCLGGHPDVQTPHIDRLAESGQLFTAAQCPAPVCGPSRSAILSGIQPSTSGCYLNPDGWMAMKNLARVDSLPKHFQKNGYRTLGVGKVFHGPGSPEKPKKVWDEFGGHFTGFGPFEGKQVRSATKEAKGVVGPHFQFLNWGPLDAEEEKGLADHQSAAWAVRQLEQTHEKPFFLGVGFRRPHVPLTAPQRFFDLYPIDEIALPPLKEDDLSDLPRLGAQAAVAHFYAAEGGDHQHVVEQDQWRSLVQAYLACVSYVDSCVGRVLDALEKSPYADNTIVVLWSDHGWGLGERFHWEKWGLWADTAQTPLIVRAPGLTKPGTQCTTPVSLIDLYPTLTDLCGLPTAPQVEGRSLRPLLTDPNAAWDRPAMTTLGRNNHALRTPEWRYIRWSDGSEELYDVEKDPDEWSNLASLPEYQAAKEQIQSWLPEQNVPAFRSHTAGRSFRLKQGNSLRFQHVAPEAVGVPITVRAKIVKHSANGVILSHGNNFAGYALYMKGGRLAFAVKDVPGPLTGNALDAKTTVVRAPGKLPTGPVNVEGRLGADGKVTLKVNGKIVSTGQCGGPLSLAPAGIMIAGKPTIRYPKYAPIGDYRNTDVFRGKLQNISVQWGD